MRGRTDALEPAAPDSGRESEQQEKEGEHPAEVEGLRSSCSSWRRALSACQRIFRRTWRRRRNTLLPACHPPRERRFANQRLWTSGICSRRRGHPQHESHSRKTMQACLVPACGTVIGGCNVAVSAVDAGECPKSMHRVYMATSRLQTTRSKACVAIEPHEILPFNQLVS